MSGIDDIAAERRRQIEAEGWSPEHDDRHTDKSLAIVAALYASPSPLYDVSVCNSAVAWRDPWPWFHYTWAGREQGDDPPSRKVLDGDGRGKHDYRRRLVIAGALLAAEIDRIDRVAPR